MISLTISKFFFKSWMMLYGEAWRGDEAKQDPDSKTDSSDGVRVRLRYLVLFLIGLLDERTGYLVQLPESWYDPDRLRTALL